MTLFIAIYKILNNKQTEDYIYGSIYTDIISNFSEGLYCPWNYFSNLLYNGIFNP